MASLSSTISLGWPSSLGSIWASFSHCGQLELLSCLQENFRLIPNLHLNFCRELWTSWFNCPLGTDQWVICKYPVNHLLSLRSPPVLLAIFTMKILNPKVQIYKMVLVVFSVLGGQRASMPYRHAYSTLGWESRHGEGHPLVGVMMGNNFQKTGRGCLRLERLVTGSSKDSQELLVLKLFVIVCKTYSVFTRQSCKAYIHSA